MRILKNELLYNATYFKHINKIVQEANDMLFGNYIFNNVWDMEPCEVAVRNDKFNWNTCYDDDREWAFMFARFDFSYKFIVAYEYNGNKSFIDQGLKYIDEWIHINDKYLSANIGRLIEKIENKGSFAHRSLDMAILASNMTDYIIYCKDNNLISRANFNRIKKVINRICKFIVNTDRVFKTNTNWGPIENSYILYTIDTLCLNFSTKSIIKRLENQLQTQIMSDGAHVESSPMYLVEILLAVLKCVRFCRSVDTTVIAEFARRSCIYLRKIATPDCCIPNLGDSDKSNISDIMILAQILFKEDFFLSRVNRELMLEFIYKYKVDPFSVEQNMGNYWKDYKYIEVFNHQILVKDPARQLYLLCSNTPNGPSGHKHYDFLSIILSIKGKEVLIDCGRETYKDGVIRRNSKSARSHNTISVNNDSYWKIIDAWRVDKKIECNCTKLIEDKNITVEMSIHSLVRNFELKRYVTYIDSIGIVITDIGDSHSDEEYETYFNFSPDGELSNGAWITNFFNGEVKLFYSNSGITTCSIVKNRCSEKYNTFRENKIIWCKTSSRYMSHYLLFSNVEIERKILSDRIRYSNKFTGDELLTVVI